MKKYLFVINPAAGGRAGAGIRQTLGAEIKKSLAAHEYDMLITEPGPVSFPAGDYATVIAAGGDGTVWQTVQTLVRHDTRPKLGIIPVGTGNDLARSLGIYAFMKARGVGRLLAALQTSRTRKLDTLSLNNSLFFTNYYGIGIDARIARDINAFRASSAVPPLSARLPGRMLYFLAGLNRCLSRISLPLQLRYSDDAGGEQIVSVPESARQVIITNIPSYAAGAQPASRCRMDDGLFEVTVISNAGQWLALHMTRFFQIPLDRVLPGIRQLQTRSIEITWRGMLPFQLDGETPAGYPQHHVISVAAPLAVLVP